MGRELRPRITSIRDRAKNAKAHLLKIYNTGLGVYCID
jgi:hypothetical protein